MVEIIKEFLEIYDSSESWMEIAHKFRASDLLKKMREAVIDDELYRLKQEG